MSNEEFMKNRTLTMTETWLDSSVDQLMDRESKCEIVQINSERRLMYLQRG